MRRFLPLLAVLLLAPAGRAQTWEPIHPNLGLSGTSGTDYVVNVTGFDGTYLYATVLHTAERRYRMFRSSTQGSTWTELTAYAAAGGAGAQTIVGAGGRVYVPQSNAGVLFYSDDQGQTWTSVSAVTPSATTVARLGNVVVVPRGASGLARRSADGGATWADSGTLLYSAVSNGTVFVGLNVGTQLARSTDGTTWTPIAINGAFGFAGLWRVGTTFFAKAAVGGVVKSTDNGATWSAVTTAATPTFGYVYTNPSGSAWLLNDAPALGTTVAITRDQGATITNVSATYPKLTTNPAALCTSNFSATTDYAIGNAWQCSFTEPGGAGLYRFRMTSGVASEPGPAAAALTLVFSPNPAAGRVTVRASGLDGQPVRVAIYDARGRLAAVLHDGPAPATFATETDVQAWAPGVYLVRLVAGGTVVTRALVVR